MPINIGLVEDQQLFASTLKYFLEGLPAYKVVVEAQNGEVLLRKMETLEEELDILLIDVKMPVMDGPATAANVSEKYPTVKLVALSQENDDHHILKMLRAGCCAYLLKDIHPVRLEVALNEVYKKGHYNCDESNINYRRLLALTEEEEAIRLTDNHRAFLKLACSDLTYKQIADQMHLAERTIDGYREEIFKKLNVQSRVGMVLEALRRKLVNL